MDPATRIQILNEAVCISHSVNKIGKIINPNIDDHLWVNSKVGKALWQPD